MSSIFLCLKDGCKTITLVYADKPQTVTAAIHDPRIIIIIIIIIIIPVPQSAGL
jgi:hypothetical protein